jgi:Asp-tRNA(Asn)/Glu-tRNA(Gln) amidotransferase A subunit family amidase
MTASWSLDKVGPLCRSVEDCALVLAAIQGADGKDLTVQDVPFNWAATLDVKSLRVGYLKKAFVNTRQSPQTDANDAAALSAIRHLGVSLVEMDLPEHSWLSPRDIQFSEMNAALKDPYQTRPADVIRQDRVTRLNGVRLFPASDYLDANRVRMLLMQELAGMMSEVDVYIVPIRLRRLHAQPGRRGAYGRREPGGPAVDRRAARVRRKGTPDEPHLRRSRVRRSRDAGACEGLSRPDRVAPETSEAMR